MKFQKHMLVFLHDKEVVLLQMKELCQHDLDCKNLKTVSVNSQKNTHFYSRLWRKKTGTLVLLNYGATGGTPMKWVSCLSGAVRFQIKSKVQSICPPSNFPGRLSPQGLMFDTMLLQNT